MYLQGLRIPIGEQNKNGRIYSKEVWKQALENPRLKQKIERREFICCNGVETFNLRDITHLVTHADLEDENVKIDLEILDTPKGKILQEVVSVMKDKGLPLRLFSSGVGSVKDGIVTEFELTAVSILISSNEGDK